MGIPILALCIFLVPNIGEFVGELIPNIAYIQYFVIFYFYLTAIPFYFALYQAFKLLSYIDKNEAFSELSVKALKNIKYSAITISVLYVISLPLFYVVAEIDDAPGIIVIGLILIFAAMVIAVFAAVLQRLLQEANDIKSENDFTVWGDRMAIIINIDVMLAKRKMSVTELSEKVGITMANISILKNGKAKAIRLSTLEAICKALDCQPGDIIEYKKD